MRGAEQTAELPEARSSASAIRHPPDPRTMRGGTASPSRPTAAAVRPPRDPAPLPPARRKAGGTAAPSNPQLPPFLLLFLLKPSGLELSVSSPQPVSKAAARKARTAALLTALQSVAAHPRLRPRPATSAAAGGGGSAGRARRDGRAGPRRGRALQPLSVRPSEAAVCSGGAAARCRLLAGCAEPSRRGRHDPEGADGGRVRQRRGYKAC